MLKTAFDSVIIIAISDFIDSSIEKNLQKIHIFTLIWLGTPSHILRKSTASTDPKEAKNLIYFDHHSESDLDSADLQRNILFNQIFF